MCLAVRSQDRMIDDAGWRHPAIDIVKRAIHETQVFVDCLRGSPRREQHVPRGTALHRAPTKGVVERLPVCPSVRRCGRYMGFCSLSKSNLYTDREVRLVPQGAVRASADVLSAENREGMGQRLPTEGQGTGYAQKGLSSSGSDQAREGRLVDALAARGDEGRGTLR